MGGLPQKAATKAASKGMTVVRRAVKKEIPVGETGNLKRGLFRKAEKCKKKGKKVYDLKYNPSMNDVFQKPIKRPGLYGGKHRTHGYYPNSVEYGFLTRAKGGGVEFYRYGRQFSKNTTDLSDWYEKFGTDKGRNLRQTKAGRHRDGYLETVQGYRNRKVEGQHPMLKGAQAADSAARDKMADTLIKEAEKIWTKD
jgi:hypothetical protein